MRKIKKSVGEKKKKSTRIRGSRYYSRRLVEHEEKRISPRRSAHKEEGLEETMGGGPEKGALANECVEGLNKGPSKTHKTDVYCLYFAMEHLVEN